MTESIRILGIAGSLRKASYNRAALRAAQRLVPDGAQIEIAELDGISPFNQDDEATPPPAVAQLKARIADSDAVLFVTPEYNRSIPGGLKNAIDWASRPYGQNSFTRKPSAVIGTSPGAIGTAIAQQQLRSVLSYCNSPQMNAPEAYIQFKQGLITDAGDVTNESTAEFLRNYMAEFHQFIVRVYTVLPRTT
jgi:chromate reductase, NAD(P)H dehydrogenase (quinone)